MAEKMTFTTGKRKTAVARARMVSGNGRIVINRRLLADMDNDMLRTKIEEPLIIAGDAWKGFDIRVNVKGGGPKGQAEAARMAIARCLVSKLGKDLKAQYMDYDRNLLVYDPRRTETHKPPHSSWGARRYKQKSKR